MVPCTHHRPNGYGKNRTWSYLNRWTETANLRKRRTLCFTYATEFVADKHNSYVFLKRNTEIRLRMNGKVTLETRRDALLSRILLFNLWPWSCLLRLPLFLWIVGETVVTGILLPVQVQAGGMWVKRRKLSLWSTVAFTFDLDDRLLDCFVLNYCVLSLDIVVLL